MTNDSVSRMCNLWQQDSSDPPQFNPEELRRRLDSFERTIDRRNLLEYVAAALVIAFFSYYAWMFPTIALRLGCGLIILGTCYVVYQLHRRASARPLPSDMGVRSCVEFQRAELVRQHKALSTVWSWYLLPFVPGMCVFLFGLGQFALQVAKAAGRPVHSGIAAVAISAVGGCIALVFVAVWQLNRWAAKKLEMQINELDMLMRDPA